MKTTQHFLLLDLIRGSAALSVLVYHLEEAAQDTHFFRGSFLAVDLFFLMSGFVLTRAYEARLKNGNLDLIGFIRVRLLRLYPLYFAAIAIGIGYYLLKLIFAPAQPDLTSDLIKAVPAALLVLPNPFPTTTFGGAYPFAPSAWSLAFELWFNLIYAALVFRLSDRWIAAITAVAGLLLAYFAHREGSFDLGWGWSTTAGGIARFWFSFGLGILIYRLIHRPLGSTWLAILLIPVGLAYITLEHSALLLQALYIYCLFPLIVGVYALRQPPAWLAAICDHAGRLSYGIYILHTPLFLIGAGIVKLMTHLDLIAFSTLHWLFISALILIASAVIIYAGDEPLRAWLTRRRKTRLAIR